MTRSIEDVLTELEALGEKLVGAINDEFGEHNDAGYAYMEPLEPSSEEQIAAAEHAAGITFPDDYRAFLKRGFNSFSATFEDEEADDENDYASAGIDWVSAEIIIRDVGGFRDLADIYDDEESASEKWLVEHGVGISFSEPHLVLSTRGIHLMLYDGEPDTSPITKTFTEFMEQWGAAMFFKSHSLKLYTDRMAKFAQPTAILVDDNKWLNYLRALYA